MVYVINSARYSAARHVMNDLNCGYTVFFIADECHRYIGSENSKIFDFLPDVEAAPGKYASLGLSATPGLDHPENASVLIPALGPEIFRYGFKEAAENNTLCPYAAFHIALSITGEEQAEYDDLSYQLSKAYSALVSRDPSLKTLHGAHFFRALYQIADLYYLFVASSSEEQSYFPIKAQTAAVYELSYLMEEDQFIYPAYEERVWAVLKDFEKKNPDSSLLSEAAGCFEHGLVRPDWLFPEAFYGEKINSAKTKSERNYWICMKQLAR